ncbi:MAG: response regulator, partial [Desulfosarcinaceae bacterium]
MSRFASLFLDNGDKEQKDLSVEGESGAAPQYNLLFVDDEKAVLKAMLRIFRRQNYALFTAETGQQALSVMEEEKIQVVVSDHRMPGMTGTDLLREIKKRWPQTIRIMLTGYADVDAVMGAVNDGAVYKFITKPWNDEDLRLTVSLALEQYDLMQENKSLKKQTANQHREIKRLSRFLTLHRSQLGNMLLRDGFISKENLDKALRIQERGHKTLPKILMDMGLVDEATIHQTIRNHQKINRISPGEFNVPPALAALIPREVCEKNIIIPLKKTDNGLIVAMADPTDFNKLDDLKFISGLAIQPALAYQHEILEKLGEVFGERESLEHALSEIDISDPTESIEIILEEEDEQGDLEDLISAKDQPPAIRIVNAIISDALRHGASDVHIEPKTKYTMVRFRIDDLLQENI